MQRASCQTTQTSELSVNIAQGFRPRASPTTAQATPTNTQDQAIPWESKLSCIGPRKTAHLPVGRAGLGYKNSDAPSEIATSPTPIKKFPLCLLFIGTLQRRTGHASGLTPQPPRTSEHATRA